jgi:hypothetical protein
MKGGKTVSGPTENDAVSYGVRIVDAEVQPGEWYWHLVRVHHLTPHENRGGHNLFCDVLDEKGQRLYGARILVWWGDNEDQKATLTVDKPPNEIAGADAALWKHQVMKAKTLGFPSDAVENVGSNHPDEPPEPPDTDPGNTLFHHSFLAVWQKIQANGGESQSLEEALRATAWSEGAKVSYDSSWAFPAYARENTLGAPLTPEIDWTFGGKAYRIQGYSGGIVYAEGEDWTHVNHIPW